MKIASHILGVALAALALTACSQDEEPVVNGPDVPGDDTAVTTYVSMSLQLPAGPSAKAPARSNPSGGEEGDGRLPGINNENTIHDISLFIYTDVAGGPGLDADASTPFVATAHFTRQQLDAYKVADKENTYLLPLRDFDPSGHFRIAVAANTGTLPAYVSNMGALRDYICARSYTPGNDGTKIGSIAGADYFVMSNAFNGAKHRSDDGRIYRPENDLEKPGTQTNPLRAEVTLERLTARIDLLYNQADFNGRQLIYRVIEAPGNSGASRNTAVVYLTHVIPVNVMQHSSYLFKRVTSGADINDNNLLVCGDETMNGQTPTNYVIEPRTLLKNDGATVPADWYGATAISNYYTTGAYNEGNIPRYSWYHVSDAATCEPGFDRYAILGYADENTQDKEVLRNDILTGLVIRASYQPIRVCNSYDPASGTLEYAELSTGFPGDFWLWRPDGLNVTDADCIYFRNYDAAAMYAGSHRGTLTYYPDGICYYNMWIRHANDNTADPGPDQRSPMEYGIVRNNVYRISFTFHGPGNLTPDNPRPTEHIRTVIYVRPWAFHRHPEIIM